jgi:DNA-binding transcriptional MerR regulator
MPIKFESLTLYSILELSERMNITAATLRAYLKGGLLVGRKVAGRWYVSEESLKKYFNNSDSDQNRKMSL